MSISPVQNKVFVEKKPKQENEGQRSGSESSNDGDESETETESNLMSHIGMASELTDDFETDDFETDESDDDSDEDKPNLHIKITRKKNCIMLDLRYYVDRK